jgi:hypothetical protein
MTPRCSQHQDNHTHKATQNPWFLKTLLEQFCNPKIHGKPVLELKVMRVYNQELASTKIVWMKTISFSHLHGIIALWLTPWFLIRNALIQSLYYKWLGLIEWTAENDDFWDSPVNGLLGETIFFFFLFYKFLEKQLLP